MPAVPVVEMLARDELLRFGEGRRDEVYAVLSSRASIRSQHQWLAALGDATAFHKIPRPNQADGERKASADASLIGAAAPDVMDRVDWANRRFITTEEIAEVLATTIEDARRTGSYVSAGSLLSKMATVVAPGDRVAHLTSLAAVADRTDIGFYCARAIANRVAEWRASPGVELWCREKLPEIVGTFFLDFAAFAGSSSCVLPAMLTATGASDDAKRSAVLDGIERHVDDLNATTVYHLVGIVAASLTPEDAAMVASRFALRLVERFPAGERDEWLPEDLPDGVSLGIGRFLYALMSDADVRIRWRAAHALRRFAAFGQREVLDGVISQVRSPS